MEVAIQEEHFGQEAPVDRPLKHELTAKVKSPAQVTNGILHEKREAEQKLGNQDRLIKWWGWRYLTWKCTYASNMVANDFIGDIYLYCCAQRKFGDCPD